MSPWIPRDLLQVSKQARERERESERERERDVAPQWQAHHVVKRLLARCRGFPVVLQQLDALVIPLLQLYYLLTLERIPVARAEACEKRSISQGWCMQHLRPTTVGGADARDVGGTSLCIIALAKERETERERERERGRETEGDRETQNHVCKK